MGNTRNLFKKLRDTKGIFHAKMGTIKDRKKKAFLSDQCKEIEENYSMGNTRDLFKNLGILETPREYLMQRQAHTKKGQKWYGPFF